MDCEAMRMAQIGVKPIARAPWRKRSMSAAQWAADDLSPEARELARHQVVIAGLEPAVDHQEHQERDGLRTLG